MLTFSLTKFRIASQLIREQDIRALMPIIDINCFLNVKNAQEKEQVWSYLLNWITGGKAGSLPCQQDGFGRRRQEIFRIFETDERQQKRRVFKTFAGGGQTGKIDKLPRHYSYFRKMQSSFCQICQTETTKCH
jgi:hypothetical protein